MLKLHACKDADNPIRLVDVQDTEVMDGSKMAISQLTVDGRVFIWHVPIGVTHMYNHSQGDENGETS